MFFGILYSLAGLGLVLTGGFISLQVNRFTQDNIPVLMDHFQETMQDNTPKEHSALRIVPVDRSIPTPGKFPVGNYDYVKK